MSILTKINGIPLFSTKQEALRWAKRNGKYGFHTHVYNKRLGYMGGKTHPETSDNIPTPTQQVNEQVVTPLPPTPEPLPTTPQQTNNTPPNNMGGY